jgi:bacteriocin biosynthesis cyclodehydratase domain-containing protein
MRLKRHFSIVAHSPDDVELRSGVWNPISFSLRDESRSGHLFRLVARLDGSASPARIAADEDVTREEVEALIDHLLELDVLETGPSNSLDYYLDNLVSWRADGDERPKRSIVIVGDEALTDEIQRILAGSLPQHAPHVLSPDDALRVALDDPDLAWLTDGLRLHEKLSAFESWRDAFVIAAVRVINPVMLRTLNRVCVEHQIPWLHAALDGPFMFIGPLVLPHRSACYECFENRVTMNLRESASYQRYKRALIERAVRHGPMPIEPAVAGMLASHTALEALNFYLTGSCVTVNKVLAVYLPTMEFTYNEVLRSPVCTACSSSPERDDTELYFDMSTFVTSEAR